MKGLIKKYYRQITKQLLTSNAEKPDDSNNSAIDEREFTFSLDPTSPMTLLEIKSLIMMSSWCCLGEFPTVALSTVTHKATVTFCALKGKSQYIEEKLVERFGDNSSKTS